MPATQTVVDRLDAMKTRIREMSADGIEEALLLMPGDSASMTDEAKIVRACLLDVYEEREGEDAVDTMMEFLGM